MPEPNLKVCVDGEIVGVLEEFCKWPGKDINEYVEEVIAEVLYRDLNDLKGSAPKAEELLNKLCEVLDNVVMIPAEDIQKIVEIAIKKRLEELRGGDAV